MSDPIPFSYKKLKDNSLSDLSETQLLTELEKSPLKDLISVQPDFILIDFYADMLYGAVKVNGSNLTGKMFKFSKSKVAEDLKIEDTYFPRKNFDKFFEVWKPKFDDFIKFQMKYLPNSKVIINKARTSDQLLNLDTLQKEKTKLKYDTNNLNSIWERLDEYAIKTHKLSYINYDKTYFLDKNYIFGEGIVHYHKNYYQDCFNGLLKIAFGDLINSKTPVNFNSDCNLIINPNFKQGFNFWLSKRQDFTIRESNGIPYINVNNNNLNKDVKSQIWSSSVQLDECDYDLSFDIKIENLSVIDSRKNIFCVRTFKDRKEYSYSSSIDSLDISLDDVTLKDGEWGTCNFKLRLKGSFVRIAPFLFRNGDVSWRNIKLIKAK